MTVSVSPFPRWVATAGWLSGTLTIVTEGTVLAAFRDEPTRMAAATPMWIVALVLGMASAFLAVIFLMGIHAEGSLLEGRRGLWALWVSTLGLMLSAGYLWAGAFVVPSLTEAAPGFLDSFDSDPSGIVAAGFIVTVLVTALGWVLVGLVLAQSRRAPAAVGLLLILGGVYTVVAVIAGLPLGSVLVGAALIWLGWWMSQSSLATADPSGRASAGRQE